MDNSVKITVVGASRDEHGSRSLYRWLRDDSKVAGNVRLVMVPDDTAPPGSMGGAEIIEAIISNGLAATSLLLAYLQWRAARRTRADAVLELRRGDQSWTFKGSPAELTEIAQALSPAAGDRPAA